jgi:thiamine biosynthesis lipoprotein
MGSEFRFVLYAASADLAKTAAQAAFAEVGRLDRMLSDFDPQSELSRLGRDAVGEAGTVVSKDLFEVLERAQQCAKSSDGAFDPTVGPVVKLWRRARRQKQLPDAEALATALRSVGHEKVRLDPATHTVRLSAMDMQLDLGGIAKGYAADRVLKVFREHTITKVMVDAGGDLVLGDAPPDAEGWQIAVEHDGMGPPRAALFLKNCAIASSGDRWQGIELDGVRYSHLVDPRTGLGLVDSWQITVQANDGATADALASAVSVLGPERGFELVRKTEGAQALAVRGDERQATAGFPGG